MTANGEAYIVQGRAKALASYPHARKINGFIFISGISSRKFDDSYEGVTELEDGSFSLDIKAQTRAVIRKDISIEHILREAGATLDNVVDITVFLINMEHYKAMNEVYNEFFKAESGPTRTTVAVKELPSPKLLIEIKAVAVSP